MLLGNSEVKRLGKNVMFTQDYPATDLSHHFEATSFGTYRHKLSDDLNQ